jgi:hypothetical protein
MKRGFSENEISNFLVDIIGQNRKYNQQKILESVYLVEIDKQLKEIVPQALRDHMHAYKYSSGRLHISTDHGIYAQQLQLYQDKILEELREKVSEDIQKIEVRVGKIYNKKHKTGDIMSRNEKLTNKVKADHQNTDIIDQLITAIKKST